MKLTNQIPNEQRNFSEQRNFLLRFFPFVVRLDKNKFFCVVFVCFFLFFSTYFQILQIINDLYVSVEWQIRELESNRQW